IKEFVRRNRGEILEDLKSLNSFSTKISEDLVARLKSYEVIEDIKIDLQAARYTGLSYTRDTRRYRIIREKAPYSISRPRNYPRSTTIGYILYLALLIFHRIYPEFYTGKSSVLEGLTKLKFPRNSGLYTRFTTQIIFRRDPSLKIQKIYEAIGLLTLVGENLPTFSSNILRLEIHRPYKNHLSIINILGIFKTTIPSLTSKLDITLIRDIIIEISRELDPDRIRILRILTKLDLIDKEAEDKIIKLIEGK
ncbi:hypothetical protein N7539_003140, partial [Penicillium diatomitis]